MKNLIVVSADHHGNCFVGLSFDKESELLTVKYLVENINDRQELAEQLTPAVENLFPFSRQGDNINGFLSIDNEVLARWLGENLIVRGKGRRPKKREIAQPKEHLYKLSCALREKKLIADDWLDQIDFALADETNPDRIEGHLVACLAVATNEVYDSLYREPLDGRGMLRR
ncbi:hypothetical protein [Chamaesiphon sp. OTE_8_metabat_110]|uniref:hypothetical protein n=1 Tax=Chamaesiphon sp. OTE_8_metabat_110 TaxID=2964696 RepID=UPI00286A4D9E|nr:hypothetical protein [Chamaesiphon sp. OTE_8_metabat_110]